MVVVWSVPGSCSGCRSAGARPKSSLLVRTVGYIVRYSLEVLATCRLADCSLAGILPSTCGAGEPLYFSTFNFLTYEVVHEIDINMFTCVFFFYELRTTRVMTFYVRGGTTYTATRVNTGVMQVIHTFPEESVVRTRVTCLSQWLIHKRFSCMS